MTDVGQVERKTQDRVVELLRDELNYRYLGRWDDRDNRNVERDILAANLRKRGYDDSIINRAIDRLVSAAALGAGRDLYEVNEAVYGLLRYGVKFKPEAGAKAVTVWLIDWENVDENDFAVAEEVTVAGEHTKRPDVVLYINGIAVGVLELKRSKVAVSEGIRQTIGNQKKDFIRPFFSTVQLVMAGNDTEGLHYAVIDTPEKYWLNWKLPRDIHEPLRSQIEAECAGVEGRLDRALVQLCRPERLLEVIHDFMVFDAGIKKTCRPNQYFGVRAAQGRVEDREGGIIWHTQGSGKSLTMVWLAKWLVLTQPDARVLIITDRTELDEQIESVFKGVSEDIHRTSSGVDMLGALNGTEPTIMCSLVHKFRGGAETDEEHDEETELDEASAEYIAEIQANVPKDFSAKGNIFVFVDEAHRTQSGTMHDAMKALLPEAMFIGFTGTPLLKGDKESSQKRFGRYIHTYKFDEAVEDGVVLDLRYEARDIEQRLTSRDKVDKWFEAKTKGMTDAARAELKKRWGRMESLYSAADRAQQIVSDILLDMAIRPRLMDARGNALLVTSSIYQACKFYEFFSKTDLKGKCAIISSYEPTASSISKEDSGAGQTEKLQQYETYRQMLADYFDQSKEEASKRVAEFEEQVTERFVKNPGQMRLLIVVDKLLTGFDAPSATYLYIDKKMANHGLFQAICRVNRLDGDDKDYGYIVDYRDLFKSLQGAITDYTSGALDGYDDDDVEGLLSDRIEEAREDLDDALEQVRALCEGVAPPKGTVQYLRYFCAKEDDDGTELAANEAKRVELYKSVAGLVRAYGNLANEMDEAGYSEAEAQAIKDEVAHYANVRDEVRLGAGENIDFKQYEADMRWLLDTYVQADATKTLVEFEDMGETGLIELIVKLGDDAIDRLPKGIRESKEAVAETIVNNVRRLVTDERPTNPKYYDKMSEILDALIDQQRRDATDYEAYLHQLIEHAKKVATGESVGTSYPDWANSPAKRALVDFELPGGDATAQAVDTAVMENKRADWVGHKVKTRMLRNAVAAVLPGDFDRLDELMQLLEAQHDYA